MKLSIFRSTKYGVHVFKHVTTKRRILDSFADYATAADVGVISLWRFVDGLCLITGLRSWAEFRRIVEK